MREFKFRAWDHTNEHIVDFDRYGSQPEDFWKTATSHGCDILRGVWISGTWKGATSQGATSHGWDIMQFTGLKDKKGNDIYEGDIVITDRFNYLDIFRAASVSFQRGYFNLSDKNNVSIGILANFHKDIEVIGNIYESPKLLSQIEQQLTKKNDK